MRIAAVLAAGLALIGCATTSRSHRVEEAGYWRVGGLDQWVTLRGEDSRKPILLLIHGGPGDAQSPFVSVYAPYEHDYVLAQWDQRGSARTFARYGVKTPDMTLERTVADGIELAEQLRRRFPENKLILLSHSWGTVIATGMAQRRPDLFAAYVGTGQISSWAETVEFQFDYLKTAARATGDDQMRAQLDAIGRPDPLNVTQYFAFTRPLRQHMKASDTAWLTRMKAVALTNGETDETIKTDSDGQGFSGAALIQTIVRQDLRATAARIDLPYCVIQGRDDLSTPTAAAKGYFERVQAPIKRFAVIEGAGHFALATHQHQFLAELKRCPGV